MRMKSFSQVILKKTNLSGREVITVLYTADEARPVMIEGWTKQSAAPINGIPAPGCTFTPCSKLRYSE
ncbi:hypothetical protein ILYODFUR_021554 [Ilyodon furcidens]|uniref:Uncharacterized protein n=1 Tax=Ilyodon furcidens TaxID=33524 RepID=A0ABV0UWS5_9TELE